MFRVITRLRSTYIRPVIFLPKNYVHNKTHVLSTSENYTIIYKNRQLNCTPLQHAQYCTGGQLSELKFEEVCEETLESLCDYFEELVEKSTHLKKADVTYGDGVLTVAFGDPYGTYVINRQTPNKQIWLSSPTSGPKRYDFVPNNNGYWVYKHDGISLHQLLQIEINKIVNDSADFKNCSHSLV